MSVYRSKTWVNIPDDLSISQLMQDNISDTPPNKIIYEEAHTGKIATYGTFHRQIRRTACLLQQRLHFQPGQIVAISASSSIDYILVAQAIWWTGGIISPINNTLHPDELRRAIELIKPRYLVIDESVHDKAHAITEKCTNAPRILTIGKRPRGSIWPSFPIDQSPSIDNEPELFDPTPVNPKDCAAILLSSGTTGHSKAVMLSHRNLVATCYQLRYDNPQNWRGSQREVFFPPLSHVYALYVCFTMCCWLGAYVCLMPRFDLELYCQMMQDRKATLARVVPPVAKLLAEEEVVRKYKYPCLEYFSCSAAPLHVRPLLARERKKKKKVSKMKANQIFQEHTATKLRETFPGVALCQSKL